MAAPFIDQPLFSAQSSANASGTAKINGNCRDITIYVKTGAGVSAGVVTIEEADNEDYTGTWSEITTVSTTAASSQYAVHLSGTYKALRARISTAITGGTVSAYIAGAEA